MKKTERPLPRSSNAIVQAFFASLDSWRARRKTDPKAKPPHRRKWYFRIEYKSSALRLKDAKLLLSNGKGNVPLVLDWPWQLPKTVVIHWTGTQSDMHNNMDALPKGHLWSKQNP